MKSPSPLRLVMAPLVCGLALAAIPPAPAAPSKKTAAPAPAAAAVETPAPKRSFFKKLNPFQKKAAPQAAVVKPAPAGNSKKLPARPAPSFEPIVEAKPPAGSMARARTLPPTPPAALTAPPKKDGFFSRLKAKLNEDPDAPEIAEKPARPADWKDHWVVTDDSVAFFEFGPSQAMGPDLRLSRGQVVKVAQSSRGWAKVELEGGRQGYIGTDQIRQAAETDFSSPVLPAATQLAAVGSGAPPQGWSPMAPPPDLPDLPMAAGQEDALLLLPPLEFEGTELKKSSMRLPPLDASGPLLQPGDALPASTPVPAAEPPVLETTSTKPAEIPVIEVPVIEIPGVPKMDGILPANPNPDTPPAPTVPETPAPAQPASESSGADKPAAAPAPVPADPSAPSPTV